MDNFNARVGRLKFLDQFINQIDLRFIIVLPVLNYDLFPVALAAGRILRWRRNRRRLSAATEQRCAKNCRQQQCNDSFHDTTSFLFKNNEYVPLRMPQ